MPRLVSMNSRLAHDAQTTDEVELCLIRITHPELDVPVRLSTDPSERISDDPLMYGTNSNWLNDEDDPFLFCLVSVAVPGDEEESAPQASLVFENVDNDIAGTLRSFIDPATIDLAIVMASTPNRIEAQWRGLQILSASGDVGSVSLTISMESIAAEPWPAGRMTRERFPGLTK